MTAWPRALEDLIRRINSISPLTAIVTPNASSNPAQGLSSKALAAQPPDEE